MTTNWNRIPEFTLGPELISNGDFSSGATDWTSGANWNITSKATHTPGSTDGLSSPLFSVDLGATYQITFVLGNVIAGSLSVVALTPGEVSTADASGTYTFATIADITGNNQIAFNPSNDFAGDVLSVSAKLEIPTSWTRIPMPSNPVTIYGTPIGLLMALTREVSVPSDIWTRISSPSTTWTRIPTAT